jgi:hypothetical protein
MTSPFSFARAHAEELTRTARWLTKIKHPAAPMAAAVAARECRRYGGSDVGVFQCGEQATAAHAALAAGAPRGAGGGA